MKMRRWVYHVAGCFGFLMLPFIFAPEKLSNVSIYGKMLIIRDFISYLLTLLFFYLSYFVLIPRFYFQNKTMLFFSLVFLCFMGITFLPVSLISFRTSDSIDETILGHINHNIFKFLLVFFASLFWRINSQWRLTQQEKLQTELSYLRGQINPHFLFNTLNSIYSMAVDKSDETAPALVKLSWMMRYVLSESVQQRVLLYKELNYIRSYVELQQFRFSHTVRISMQVNGDPTGKKIAPILLIPFVENAFKHGVNAEADSSIKIVIDILPDRLRLLVENNLVPNQIKEEERSGLGIDNTRNRLELLYPDRHRLKISQSARKFIVELELETDA